MSSSDILEALDFVCTVAACLRGDPLAWKRLFGWTRGPLWDFCKCYLGRRGVKDVNLVDEVCAAVLALLPDQTSGLLRQYRDSIEPGEPTLEGLNAFLRKLARNQIFAWLRTEKRRRRREKEAARPNRQPPSITAEQVLEAKVAVYMKLPAQLALPFFCDVLYDIPERLRNRPRTSAERQLLFKLIQYIKRKIETGEVETEFI
jgi:DNA-directed RNA polymerase specialized sigma24 family protein